MVNKEGVAQLKTYAKDKKIPALAKDTTLHQILYQFKGAELVCAKQIAEERM